MRLPLYLVIAYYFLKLANLVYEQVANNWGVEKIGQIY
jgi:hypothetical protein